MGGWAMRLLALILAIVIFSAPTARAEKRVALVIGNKDYKTSVGPLANPLNDIRLVNDALRSVGFEVLKPVQNATRSEMLQAIYAFASTLKSAGPDFTHLTTVPASVRNLGDANEGVPDLLLAG
jgi:hypothetical protein